MSRLTERQQMAYMAAKAKSSHGNPLLASPFRIDKLLAGTLDEKTSRPLAQKVTSLKPRARKRNFTSETADVGPEHTKALGVSLASSLDSELPSDFLDLEIGCYEIKSPSIIQSIQASTRSEEFLKRYLDCLRKIRQIKDAISCKVTRDNTSRQ